MSQAITAAPSQRPSREGLNRAAQQLLLILAPLFVVAWELQIVISQHTLGVDFKGWYWLAGHRVLHGMSPYTIPAEHALNYPAFGALVFVPFGALPSTVANVIFVVIVAGSLPLTLRLLEVRDWRVYAVAVMWQPVMVGWETANVSLLLICGLAAIWRYRDRQAVVGVILALLVSVKFFIAPVGLWLLLTRRFRAAAWAVAVTLALNVVSWAILGFDQIRIYLHVISKFAAVVQSWGYSLIDLVHQLGVSQPLADASGVIVAAAVIGAALRVRHDRERVLFGAVIAACLFVSPVVEAHYLALMLVPVALASKRLSAAWLVPILLIFTPADHPGISAHVFSLVVSTSVLLWALFGYPPAPRRSYSNELPSPAT